MNEGKIKLRIPPLLSGYGLKKEKKYELAK